MSQQPLHLVDRPAGPRRPAHRVTSSQVHPVVWATALKAAGGVAGRLEVISDTEVYIHNSKDWRA